MAEIDEWHLKSDRQYQGLINKFWCLVLVGPVGGLGFLAITAMLAADGSGTSAEKGQLGLLMHAVLGIICLAMLVNGLRFPWGLVKLYRAHQMERDWILLRSLEEQVYTREASIKAARLLQQMKDESQ